MDFFWYSSPPLFPPAPHPVVMFVTDLQASGQEQQGLVSGSSTLRIGELMYGISTGVLPPPLPSLYAHPTSLLSLSLKHYYLWQQLWNIGGPPSWELSELSGDGREEKEQLVSGWCEFWLGQGQRSCFFLRIRNKTTSLSSLTRGQPLKVSVPGPEITQYTKKQDGPK